VNEGKVVAIGSDSTRVIPVGDRKAAEAKEYTVVVDAPETVVAGEPQKFSVVLTPRGGWKLNKEFPTKLSVKAEGAALPSASQGVKDATSFHEKKGAEWQMSFNSQGPGDATFVGNFKFAVCTDTVCDPKTEKLAFTVAVKPPATK